MDNVTGFTGGSRVNSGMMFITLKPRDQRHETAQQVIDRLRQRANEPGANLFPMAVQDIRVGGRQSNASYQYTLAVRRPRRALRRVGAEDPQSAVRRCRSWRTSTPISGTMAPKWTSVYDPGYHVAPRHQRPGRQQPAEQRFRPAADLYHLPAAQPVLRW
ncbi:efflux RND transporter permease subunit [Klebsiella pneumoniae subsp. pneumoniae]|nr:efflux RND transporter permease subunit [Klebsiella pneumoniae subsp. pneumoniae]